MGGGAGEGGGQSASSLTNKLSIRKFLVSTALELHKLQGQMASTKPMW